MSGVNLSAEDVVNDAVSREAFHLRNFFIGMTLIGVVFSVGFFIFGESIDIEHSDRLIVSLFGFIASAIFAVVSLVAHRISKT